MAFRNMGYDSEVVRRRAVDMYRAAMDYYKLDSFAEYHKVGIFKNTNLFPF